MGSALTQARYGSGGAVLAPRWMVSQVLCRHPDTITRHCTPVACDVHTRALLYDVDAVHDVLEVLLPGTPRGKKNHPLAHDLGQLYPAVH